MAHCAKHGPRSHRCLLLDGHHAEHRRLLQEDHRAGAFPGRRHGPQGDSIDQREYRAVKPVWVGPFSDHCLAVRPGDRSILFSVLLAHDLALQAVAHYSKKRQRVSENEVGGEYYFYQAPRPSPSPVKLPLKDPASRGPARTSARISVTSERR
jgi:hypothetical protein